MGTLVLSAVLLLVSLVAAKKVNLRYNREATVESNPCPAGEVQDGKLCCSSTIDTKTGDRKCRLNVPANTPAQDAPVDDPENPPKLISVTIPAKGPLQTWGEYLLKSNPELTKKDSRRLLRPRVS